MSEEQKQYTNEKLKSYVEKFNSDDEETVVQLVSNADAYEFLYENAPRLECPDEVIEETFAFRTWTVRKHLKNSSDGVMMSEFLPEVNWAGRHNTINAALFHHLNEYRWFKNAEILKDYALFFLENKDGRAYNYSTPALTAIYEYFEMTGNGNIFRQNPELAENYFNGWEEGHLSDSGLYWSVDNYDAMEWSISGSTPDKNGKALFEKWKTTCEKQQTAGKALKGLRPTLNAYMYADALTLAKIFDSVNKSEKADFYRKKAANIKKLVDERLWDGDFYKAVHAEKLTKDLSVKDLASEMNVRELLAYNLWAAGLPDGDKAGMFKYLKDERVFKANTGFATADRSHPRYLYEFPHECLWNGYVWPYATSQTLNAVIVLLNNYGQDVIDNFDLYDFVKTYAGMHYIEDEKGRHSFIDEVMSPDRPVWCCRELLKGQGWPSKKGGYERGKDYNHSTFIDIVIRGLIGVDANAPALSVKPRVKGIWKWFKLENLTYVKRTYDIYYDEDGTKYGKGAGVIIEEK